MVVSSLVSEQGFDRYINFLLGDTLSLLGAFDYQKSGSGIRAGKSTPLMDGLYEKMLKIVAQDSKKLNNVDRFIQSLPQDQVPANFKEFFEIFKKYTKRPSSKKPLTRVYCYSLRIFVFVRLRLNCLVPKQQSQILFV